MCGIIYSKNLTDNKPVNSLIKLMYYNQKNRGTQGYGFIGLNSSNLDTYRALDENGFLSFLSQHDYDEILLHHRLPTSTENTLQSTHPFIVSHQDKKYYFIHNGIIVNADELQKKHYKKGIKYSSMNSKDKSFNDSEALAWEVVLYLHKQQTQIDAIGSVAFICMETDKESNRALKLYFYHNNSSPLRILQDTDSLILSSEGNWGDEVKQNKLYFYDYQAKSIKKHSKLTIQSMSAFQWDTPIYYGDEDDYWYDWDAKSLQKEIQELERERDYLVSTGDYIQANELDEEIEYLRDELIELSCIEQAPN